MIGLAALCLYGFFETLTGVYTGGQRLYVTSSSQVFSADRTVHRIVGDLRAGERFIGTDTFSRPLVDQPGFRQLMKPMTGPWVVGKDDTVWDFSRFILGIRSGVLVSSRASVTAIDFQPDKSELGKLKHLSFESELSPMMNPSVSPERDTCAVALQGKGVYAIAVTDLIGGSTAIFHPPSMGCPLIQVECVKRDLLILLAGNEPSLDVESPFYGKTSFIGNLFLYDLTSRQLKKIRSVSLRSRKSYLARSASTGFVILSRTELVTIDVKG